VIPVTNNQYCTVHSTVGMKLTQHTRRTPFQGKSSWWCFAWY